MENEQLKSKQLAVDAPQVVKQGEAQRRAPGMDTFVINGGRPISGSIAVEGSKNAALPIMAGALLISGKTQLRNVPALKDIAVMAKLLSQLGAEVVYDADSGEMTIDATALTSSVAPYELVSQMRGAFVSLGPLRARLGEAKVSLPGGCSLGARPVDYHIRGLRAMGFEISEEAGYVIAQGKVDGDSTVCFDRQSHTGTENIMFAAALGSGTTTIINAACDPEVVDVANFLNAAGGKVTGAGTAHMTITAVPKLNPVEHTISADRLIAGTYLYAAAATGGEVEITGAPAKDLTIVLDKLTEMGCDIRHDGERIILRAPERLKPTNIVTCPYPGFPTDLQPCALAAMITADGVSRLRETIFEDRFGHAMEMRRLGADITISSDEAIINGSANLQGATVMAGDIRAGAGLVIACLASAKQSVVRRVYHIDRGYARLEEKLRSLRADIERRTE